MQKITSLIFITLIFISLLSCRKDKLEGDFSILVGEWDWIETISHPPYFIYTPESEGYNKTLIFKEKGKYKLLKDGEVIESGRTLVSINTEIDSSILIDFKRNSFFFLKSEFEDQQAIFFFNNNNSIEITQADVFGSRHTYSKKQ